MNDNFNPKILNDKQCVDLTRRYRGLHVLTNTGCAGQNDHNPLIDDIILNKHEFFVSGPRQ